MWLFRALVGVLLVIVLLGFFVYNAEERVAVNLIQTRYINVPLVVVVFWSFVFGMLVSFLMSVTIYLKQTGDIRRLKRAVDSLNSEIIALRNRPIEESDDKFLLSKKEENND